MTTMPQPTHIITVPAAHYSLNAIMATCTQIADHGWSFHLTQNHTQNTIEIHATPKSAPTVHAIIPPEQLTATIQTALQEHNLRFRLITKNKPNREKLTYNALSNPAFLTETAPEPPLPESLLKILNEDPSDTQQSYLDDPLNIALPWENKQ